MKKISIVSSSRADYGILKNLIIKLQKDRSIKLNFYVTGSHLNSNFGKTIKEIYRDKLKISKKIPMSFGNGKNINMSKVISQGITNFSKIFYKDKSDLIIILGDRYEIFSVAIAAMVCQVPIAHLHGGELTKGAIDESIRHSISKCLTSISFQQKNITSVLFNLVKKEILYLMLVRWELKIQKK